MHSSKPHAPCKMLNPLSHSYSSLQRARTNRLLLQLLLIQVVGLRDLAHTDNLTLIVRGTTKDSARIQESAPPAPPPAPGPPLKTRERIRRLPVVDPHHIHLVQTFLYDRAATSQIAAKPTPVLGSLINPADLLNHRSPPTLTDRNLRVRTLPFNLITLLRSLQGNLLRPLSDLL